MLDLSTHRVAVAFALRELERRLAQLTQALGHTATWCRVVDTECPSEGLKRIIAAYTGIDLAMEDTVNVSPVCLGVVGVEAHVMQLALAVNVAKEELKAVCAPLQRIRTRIPLAKQADGRKTRALPVVRVVLRMIQRSDLNLLAAYRRIPVLRETPKRVVYTRARTRSVYRMPVAAVQALLENSDKPGAADDRARLRLLTRHDTHLGLVRPHYENIRANVTYRDAARGARNSQIAAELPLMFVTDAAQSGPEVVFPGTRATSDATPRKSRTARLESVPYLSTLPVYRYVHIDANDASVSE
jgi:hypothetical protein